MKKSFLLVAIIIYGLQVCGQGTLQLTPGATLKTNGPAYLVLHDMHLVSNGTFQQTLNNGEVKFTGIMDVDIAGSSTASINNLLLAKTGIANLNLSSNINVLSKVNFSGGLLNLGNSVLNLGTTGEFSNESEFSRAYTIGNGYAQVTGTLNNPNSINLGKLGAVITSTSNMGSTIIKRGHKVQTAISGANNSILRYYDIEPSNNTSLKATFRFFYFDAELNSISKPSLHQYRSKDMINWAFIGAESRNTIDNYNYVEQKNISFLDRMTLATASVPTITTCPTNITTTSNVKGCKASVSFGAIAEGIPAPVVTYRIGNTLITSPHTFSKGTTTVTVTASNGVLPNDACTFTVTVMCGSGSNNLIAQRGEITEIKTDGALSLSARPNPALSFFTIDIRSDDLQKLTLRVLDATGKLIETRQNIDANSSLQLGHKYRSGVYFIEAIQGKVRRTVKLIKSGS